MSRLCIQKEYCTLSGFTYQTDPIIGSVNGEATLISPMPLLVDPLVCGAKFIDENGVSLGSATAEGYIVESFLGGSTSYDAIVDSASEGENGTLPSIEIIIGKRCRFTAAKAMLGMTPFRTAKTKTVETNNIFKIYKGVGVSPSHMGVRIPRQKLHWMTATANRVYETPIANRTDASNYTDYPISALNMAQACATIANTNAIGGVNSLALCDRAAGSNRGNIFHSSRSEAMSTSDLTESRFRLASNFVYADIWATTNTADSMGTTCALVKGPLFALNVNGAQLNFAASKYRPPHNADFRTRKRWYYQALINRSSTTTEFEFRMTVDMLASGNQSSKVHNNLTNLSLTRDALREYPAHLQPSLFTDSSVMDEDLSRMARKCASMKAESGSTLNRITFWHNVLLWGHSHPATLVRDVAQVKRPCASFQIGPSLGSAIPFLTWWLGGTYTNYTCVDDFNAYLLSYVSGVHRSSLAPSDLSTTSIAKILSATSGSNYYSLNAEGAALDQSTLLIRNIITDPVYLPLFSSWRLNSESVSISNIFKPTSSDIHPSAFTSTFGIGAGYQDDSNASYGVSELRNYSSCAYGAITSISGYGGLYSSPAAFSFNLTYLGCILPYGSLLSPNTPGIASYSIGYALNFMTPSLVTAWEDEISSVDNEICFETTPLHDHLYSSTDYHTALLAKDYSKSFSDPDYLKFDINSSILQKALAPITTVVDSEPVATFVDFSVNSVQYLSDSINGLGTSALEFLNVDAGWFSFPTMGFTQWPLSSTILDQQSIPST